MKDTESKGVRPLKGSEIAVEYEAHLNRCSEEAAQKSQELYDEFIEGVTDAVWELLLDRIDVSTGKVVIIGTSEE